MADSAGPGFGIGSDAGVRLGGRTRPASISACNGERAIAVICATARPRSVIVIVSPDAASATTADAFCFSALMPTSLMCFNVAHAAQFADAPRAASSARPSRWTRSYSVGASEAAVSSSSCAVVKSPKCIATSPRAAWNAW